MVKSLSTITIPVRAAKLPFIKIGRTFNDYGYVSQYIYKLMVGGKGVPSAHNGGGEEII